MGLKTKTGRRVLAAVLAVSTMGLLALGTSSPPRPHRMRPPGTTPPR